MNLIVTSSPHIRGKETTARIMADVLLALMPALVVGIYVQGLRALAVTLVTMAVCLAGEALMQCSLKRSFTLFDGSATVTGLLLAMTLPASVPYWVAAVGGLFAVAVAKALCGGLGQNVFNPALAARALLMLVFPVYLIRFPAVGQPAPLLGAADVVTAATPLHAMQMPVLPQTTLVDLLIGRSGGTIGEVSALALMLGGVYLLARKVISLRIPAAYLGTVALLTLVFHKTDAPLLWMLYSLVSGGLLLGAIFMATDYATSPVTPWGQILYGVGCGILTVVFRYTGLFPEGVTYAILLMNAAVWMLDRYTAPRRFGSVKGGAET